MSDNLTGVLSSSSQELSGELSNTTPAIFGTLNQFSLDHRTLTGRDAENQHPIGSISTLEAELEWRPSQAMTNSDIQAILNS